MGLSLSEKMSFGRICRTIGSEIFYYETERIIYLESIKLGLIYRSVQLTIIAYIVGYAILYKKGYQDTDVAMSSVTSKVKGIAFTNSTDLPDVYNQRIWDTADYVVPPQENGAFFIMTNAIITRGQTQGICNEDLAVEDGRCNLNNNTCVEGQSVRNGNGVQTGSCTEFFHTGNYTCEIRAWCPVENDTLIPALERRALITDADAFTVLIKNSIEFVKFGVKRRNIIDSVNNASYLKSCLYHPLSHPYCPVYRIGDIVSLAQANWTKLSIEGGVIGIVISWNCNLDFDVSYCVPTYTFNRLDDENAKLAPGWNFRFANFYSENGTMIRDLFKSYGILFVVSVEAKAGKFSIIPLALNVGSGLALLSVASIVCDTILLYVLRKRKFYRETKYQKIRDDEGDEQPIVSNMTHNESHLTE